LCVCVCFLRHITCTTCKFTPWRSD
jgi:hypothetical protein